MKKNKKVLKVFIKDGKLKDREQGKMIKGELRNCLKKKVKDYER